MLKVTKRSLLLFAGCIWMIAGSQIFKIGIQSIPLQHLQMICIISSAAIIFTLFLRFVFLKLVKKHTLRIQSYSQVKQPFYYFFDFKSYLLMAMMMGGGIAFRRLGFFPFFFVAFFYTGLGAALFSAGIGFVYQWCIYKEKDDVQQDAL